MATKKKVAKRPAAPRPPHAEAAVAAPAPAPEQASPWPLRLSVLAMLTGMGYQLQAMGKDMAMVAWVSAAALAAFAAFDRISPREARS